MIVLMDCGCFNKKKKKKRKENEKTWISLKFVEWNYGNYIKKQEGNTSHKEQVYMCSNALQMYG